MTYDEKYKLSDHDTEMIKYFRERAEQNAGRLIDANGLDFTEENRAYTYRLTAAVHFDSFDMCVYYYPILFPETEYSDYIDFSLKFPSSEYKFSIYDIFNYLDIEDFNLYYYNKCTVKSSLDSAVDNIFAVCQKYADDIDYIAKNSDAVVKLEKQCDADEYITNDFESDEYTADNEDMIDDLEFITSLRPENYGSNPQKAISRLRKNEKNGLNGLYERRFLKYLEAGNLPPVNSSVGNKKSDRKYLMAEIITAIAIAAASVVIAFTVMIILQKMIFGDAYIPDNDPEFGTVFGLSIYQFINASAAGILLFIAGLFLLGGKIISLFAPKEDKESYLIKFIVEDSGIKNKKTAKTIGIIFLILFVICCAINIFMMI